MSLTRGALRDRPGAAGLFPRSSLPRAFHDWLVGWRMTSPDVIVISHYNSHLISESQIDLAPSCCCGTVLHTKQLNHRAGLGFYVKMISHGLLLIENGRQMFYLKRRAGQEV